MTEPTNCDKCKASLDNGYSYLYEGSELIGATCFKCSAQEELEKYIETKRLHSRFVNNITLDLYSLDDTRDYKDKDNDYNNKSLRYLISSASAKEFEVFKNKVDAYYSYIKICEKIKLFESEVWRKGLQKIIMNSHSTGVSANLIGIKCLTFSMCGRTMFTIDDNESSITMMCIEDSNNSTMHFRGIDATEQRAIELIDFVIETFNDGSLIFKDDNEVSYCGM